MSKLGTAAKALSSYLNEFGTGSPDWYFTALEETGADFYFDDQETQAADPSHQSDLFILCDGLRSLRVEYFPHLARWAVN